MSFLSDIPYVAAKWQITPSPGTRIVKWIVVHDMETAETDTTAENLGYYFAYNPDILDGTRKASTHYGVDNNSIERYADLDKIVYGAGGANLYGVHIEHAGFARQTREEWLDEYGIAMLKLSARLTRELCKEFSVPMVYKDYEALQRGEWGITTHAQVTAAFHQDDHTDPGPNFPMDMYIKWVNVDTQDDEDEDMNSYVLYRDGRYQNLWLTGGGGAVHMSPTLAGHYIQAGVPTVTDTHDQTLKSMVALSGIEMSDLVPA